MKAERTKLIKEARLLLDKVNAESRNLTEQEEQRFQELNDEIDRRQVTIEHEERQQMLENDLEQRDHEPHPDPVQSPQEEQRNWRSFSEQMQAVYRAAVPDGRIDQRLSTRAASGLNESIGTDGGFLVSA